MILGMSTQTFTLLHVVISLMGIASGLIVVTAMLRSARLPGLTAIFLITTVATSATGFLFHSEAFGPPHAVGVLSLVILAVALYALYGRGLAGRWRAAYVIGASLALYLNVFVGVTQAFQKIPSLHELAPQGNEPPFVVTQLIVLALFVWLTVAALKRFHPVSP